VKSVLTYNNNDFTNISAIMTDTVFYPYALEKKITALDGDEIGDHKEELTQMARDVCLEAYENERKLMHGQVCITLRKTQVYFSDLVNFAIRFNLSDDQFHGLVIVVGIAPTSIIHLEGINRKYITEFHKFSKRLPTEIANQTDFSIHNLAKDVKQALAWLSTTDFGDFREISLKALILGILSKHNNIKVVTSEKEVEKVGGLFGFVDLEVTTFDGSFFLELKYLGATWTVDNGLVQSTIASSNPNVIRKFLQNKADELCQLNDAQLLNKTFQVAYGKDGPIRKTVEQTVNEAVQQVTNYKTTTTPTLKWVIVGVGNSVIYHNGSFQYVLR